MKYRVAMFIGVPLLLVIVPVVLYAFFVSDFANESPAPSFTDTEAGFEAEPPEPLEYRIGGGSSYSLEELRSWQREPGPKRVGLQIGHKDNDVMPEELSGLTANGAGATYGTLNERDTVSVIADLVAQRLTEAGVDVTLLPATVPPGFEADAFVSIHADGNRNEDVRGFKIAGPRRDYSGRSEALVNALYETYQSATGLSVDGNVTRRMTAYYAFNWPRYEHAVHPFTPAAIVETGFLTNAADRDVIVTAPERAAQGIANGIIEFLEAEVSPQVPPQSLTAPQLPLSGTVVCAPVRTERRNRSQPTCVASLLDEAGHYYMLMDDEPIATSSLPYSAKVDGQYHPIQVLENYFWFHFEARGLIEVSSLLRL